MPKYTRKEIIKALKNIKNIIITEQVIEFILQQESNAADKIIRSIDLLSEMGFYLPKTYYHRLWESEYKLWELITSFGKNEYRSLFFSVKGGNYLIAHAIIKNTSKVPKKDIKIAENVYVKWLEKKEEN